MRKETVQEISRLANKVRELTAKLKTSTEALNFYKDQNAKQQTIIGQLEARLNLMRDFTPILEAPENDLPEPTKEDY